MSTPVSLDSVEQSGAIRFGRTVAKLVVIYSDGKRLSVELPEPADADQTSEPRQRRILAILEESEKPLTRKQIALKLGRPDARGRLGESIRQLVSAGLIFESGGELTDDASKFSGTI